MADVDKTAQVEALTDRVKIEMDLARIEEFCRRRGIVEFSIFGSALREDFGPESDIDVLVTFKPGAGITFDNRVELLDELRDIFGREADLVEEKSLRNPFRRHAIISSREVIYAG